MRIKIFIACAAAALISSSATAQAEPQCTDQPLARICIGQKPAAALTGDDYGLLLLQLTPPADVNEASVKANKKGWKKWVQRYLVPNAKSGVVVLEIRQTLNGTSYPLATIPVASFSVDEKSGVKVETSAQFSTAAQISPYFRLTDTSAVSAKLSIKSSSAPSSNVLGTVTQAIGLAEGFGAGGWLVSTAADPAIKSSLGTIETTIANNFSATTDSQVTVTAAFKESDSITFDYALSPHSARTGRATIFLTRRPSLFTPTATVTKQPDFSTVAPNGRTDSGVTRRFLTHSIAPGKDLLTHIQSASANQLGNFQSQNVSRAVFGAACEAVKEALRSQTFPLNSHDYVAVFWATWVSGSNAHRTDLLNEPCLKNELGGFKAYGLGRPSSVKVARGAGGH